jgi:hypothetical protein
MSGYSNLINSNAISTPEAIGAATRIKADMDSKTVHDLSSAAHISHESQVLHAAACILRMQISDITIPDVLLIRFEYPDIAVVVLLSNHQNVFLIYVVVCVMCSFLSFRSEGRNAEKMF